MSSEAAGLVIWDLDGTLIPADLRWLRRAVARAYRIDESAVVFPAQRVHGYTDESIAIDTAVCSGVDPSAAESGVPGFREALAQVLADGRKELQREQPAYPGAVQTISALHQRGFIQTLLTGNLRVAAELKLRAAGLDPNLDLSFGGFDSDARDRFELPAIVARRFAARHGHALDPDRTVVIGDALNDIACARYAGFRVVVVAHRLSHDELVAGKPDAILERLAPELVVSAVDNVISFPTSRRTNET